MHTCNVCDYVLHSLLLITTLKIANRILYMTKEEKSNFVWVKELVGFGNQHSCVKELVRLGNQFSSSLYMLYVKELVELGNQSLCVWKSLLDRKSIWVCVKVLVRLESQSSCVWKSLSDWKPIFVCLTEFVG